MADNELDPGFDEVHLDEGFDEVPADDNTPVQASAPAPEKTLSQRSLEDVAEFNPMSIGAGIGRFNMNMVNKLRGKDQRPWDEIAKESYQTGKDFTTGALQGGTLGGIDEVTGGLAAAGKKLTGDDRPIGDIYREEQKGGEAAIKEAKKRSPGFTTAGEISGGVASSMLVPTVGIEGAISKGLGSVGMKGALAAAKNSSRLGKIFAGGKEIAKQLPGVIAETATLGGIQGGLSSEGELGSEQMKQDIKGGATLGGLFGGGSKIATEVVPAAARAAGEPVADKAKEFIKNSPFLRQTMKAFEGGKAGRLVSESSDDIGRIAGEQSDAVGTLSNKFINAEDDIGKSLQKVIEDATIGNPAKGIPPVKLNLSDELDNAANKIIAFGKNSETLKVDKEYSNLMSELFLLKNNQLSPKQAVALKDKVYKLANSMENPELTGIANSFAKSIKESLSESVPGFKELNDQFYNLRKSGRETFAAHGKDPAFNEKFISDFQNNKLKTYGDVEWVLKDLTTPGAGKLNQQKALEFLKTNLAKTEAAHPGTLKKLGYDSIDSFEADIISKADDFALTEGILGQNPQGEGLSSAVRTAWRLLSLGSSPTGRGTAFAVAQKAGQATTKLGLNKARGILSSMYKAPKQVHLEIAGVMSRSNNKLAQQYGKMLTDAINNNNVAGRNAALFVIQQNPELRKMANDMLPGEGHEQ